MRSKFERTYQTYLKRVLDRHSRAKSFFVRSEPVPLYEFFVPLDLARGWMPSTILRSPSAVDLAKSAPHAILTGSGGAGKTMVMRHILISTIRERAKTPIFFELRQLNHIDETVRDGILRVLRANGLEVDNEYLELGLQHGHFSLLLDGFDELQQSRRVKVATEIQDFADRYPANRIVVSSRPDSEFDGWPEFVQFRVQPLDLERASELVMKLPFEDPIKAKFVTDLRDTLYDNHESFLSNPLLLSIMLLTYSDVAHIPDKLSIFYSQAYEALFQKHDALKSGFERERRSGLDVQDFARAFAAFCIQSYDGREFTFSRSRALELLQNAKRLTQLDYLPEALLSDALQAVCLLVEEGLDIAFTHRSFQEYFVARFIYSCPPDVKRQLVERSSSEIRSDSAMSLLHEIDPYSVEIYLLLPLLKELRRRIKLVNRVGISHFLRYLAMLYESFHADPKEKKEVVASIKDGLFHTLDFLEDRYPITGETLTGRAAVEEHDAISQCFFEEYGPDGHLLAKSLKSTHKFARVLYESTGYWGAGRLRNILAIEKAIEGSHSEIQSSLETILGQMKGH